MARAVRNEVKAVVNESRLQSLMMSNGVGEKAGNLKKYTTVKELYEDIKRTYGLDISYKTFTNLTSNKVEWYLTYAMCVCDFFGASIGELFNLVKSE